LILRVRGSMNLAGMLVQRCISSHSKKYIYLVKCFVVVVVVVVVVDYN